MKIKEEKISSLEKKLEESNALNATLRAELAANASLQTESSLLKEQLKQLENQNTSLNNQIVALQRNTTTLQEQNSSLHTQTAKVQVENSTLSSQSASLMAQNAVLQGQVTALETEVESWQRQREEAWRGRESVLSDHERLLSVHERQANEYEQLISQHAALKCKQRALENEHRSLHSKYCVLLQQKEKWEEQEGRGQKEKEQLSQELLKNRLLQQENQELKTEVNRLTESQSQHLEHSEGLQQRANELKSSLSSAQQELLSRLKGNLEEENHHLLSQINLLSQQNHTLLERSMESKELFHQEQKLYIDKLNSLRRQKEKLEEKIMDQYKFYDPTPKKRSQWSGAKALAKLIKPRKEGSREREKEGGKERERAKSRMGSDSQDGGHAHSNHNNHTSSLNLAPQSPALTPISRAPSAPKRFCFLRSKSQDKLLHSPPASSSSSPPSRLSFSFNRRLRFWSSTDITSDVITSQSMSQGFYCSSTPGGSSESVNGEDGHGQGQAHKTLSSTPSHQSSSLGLINNSNRVGQGPSRRTREESCHNASDPMYGHHGNKGGRPGSADLSHNTSSSNSPVNCRDTIDCQAHSTSLSSDDVTGLSRSQLALSRSSTLPYDQTPQRAQPQRGGGVRTKTRQSSPGSEMVTLEEFLQESNKQSPLMVSTGSREDLMTDYFTRSSAPSAPTRDQVTPTSYVTPTVQPSIQRPGQSVKPSPRQPVGQSHHQASPHPEGWSTPEPDLQLGLS
ncbi:hypothetical protein INR49_006413 [Caranx melampygus]|nr:hypothetical protein INR49_006413 [Caranx melampygus]